MDINVDDRISFTQLGVYLNATSKKIKKHHFILLSIAVALKLPAFIPQAEFFQIYPPRKVFSEERGETGGNLRGTSELRTRH